MGERGLLIAHLPVPSLFFVCSSELLRESCKGAVRIWLACLSLRLRLLVSFGLCLSRLVVSFLLTLLRLSSFLRSEGEEHLLTFERRHALNLGELFEVVGKAEEEHFTLFFEDDGAPFEEDVSLHLVAVAEELLSVLELEGVVGIARLGSETYFLNFDLDLLSFEFLCFLFLLVEELGVVDESTYRRLCVRRYLYKVYTFLVSKTYCVFCVPSPTILTSCTRICSLILYCCFLLSPFIKI